MISIINIEEERNLVSERRRQMLKTLRANKRITQEQLAKAIGKSINLIRRYESGETEIRLVDYELSMMVLGLKLQYVQDDQS